MATGVGVRLVVGLGNPGARYERTRHNVGFEVVQALGRAWGAAFRTRFEGLADRVVGPVGPVVLLMPHTFMNESGRSVAQARRRLGIAPAEILVVHDDLDLPVGAVRVRPRGSSGGHNGLKSIMDVLASEDFGRVRIGIGRPALGREVIDHVLSRFSPAERPQIDDAVVRGANAVERVLALGYEAAMNAANGGPAATPPRG